MSIRAGAVAAALIVAMSTLTHSLTQTAAPDSGVGSAKVVPIQITGDDASRFTLVVLADGYTAADMPKFRANLDKHLNILWSFEPYRSYRNYFNVYAVEAVSKDSGIICDPGLLEEPNMDPKLRETLQHPETVFGLSFGGGCTSVTARGVTPSSGGQAKVREYAQKATPNPDQILVIGNSNTYGGIGGGIATSTGSNALSPLITPHEIGHSLGRLTDEYTYSARGVAGGTYNASRGEPASAHMTIMTAADMKAQQKKWWRWLGEPSEAGGLIDVFEGGSGNTKGIWRPSKHSIMISLGYAYDQVGREQMVKAISAKVGLIAGASATDYVWMGNDVLWINPAHPVYHDLDITWRLGDRIIEKATSLPYLNLKDAGLSGSPEPEKVTVTVVDPTEFVRDPDLRASVMTATRTFAVGGHVARAELRFPASQRIVNSTQTMRPIGAADVAYIDLAIPKTSETMPLAAITWRLDNNIVADAANRLSFPLAPRKLSPGTHTLTVTLGAPRTDVKPAADQTRSWKIDNTLPTVSYILSDPVGTAAASTPEPHYFMRDAFTMKLDPKDDQPGYLVAEFRVNGDGWSHYFGWPDAPPGTPFKFTARGTNIKELIYGSLSKEGLSPQPWEPREPGWGTHRIEYRAKDAAGNIGDAKAFRVTIEPKETCTATVTGQQAALNVTTGVTCVNGATIAGPVTVAAGASLVATNAKIAGALTATGAATIELVGTSVDGTLKVTGTTGRVTLFGVVVGGDTTIETSTTAAPPLITGSTLKGALACSGNSQPPTNGGTKNAVAKGLNGQCTGM